MRMEIDITCCICKKSTFDEDELIHFEIWHFCLDCFTEENIEKVKEKRREIEIKREEYFNQPEVIKETRKFKYKERLRQWERIRKLRKEFGENIVIYGKENPLPRRKR